MKQLDVKLFVKNGDVLSEFTVPTGISLMELSYDHSLPILFGCGQGVCG